MASHALKQYGRRSPLQQVESQMDEKEVKLVSYCNSVLGSVRKVLMEFHGDFLVFYTLL